MVGGAGGGGSGGGLGPGVVIVVVAGGVTVDWVGCCPSSRVGNLEPFGVV